MFNFKCTECELEIQADYKYIGDAAECPQCGNVQIIPDPPMPAGAEFHGYIIDKMLGSDLMWSTYKASPIVDNGTTHVVLKIPTTFFLNSVTNFDEFCAMLEQNGTLEAPEFTSLIGKSLVPGKVFFVYEFIDNGRLMTSLATSSPILHEQDTLLIVRRIAIALKKLWDSKQMIHQNLTPSNINILPDQSIKIRNLGISQFALTDDTLLENGFNIWEYKYLSPEFMVDGDATQPVSAIYSLGGLFYLLLTGHHPYADEDFDTIGNATLTPIKKLAKGVTTQTARLAELMLEKDIDIRLNEWKTVINRLDDILGKEVSMTETTLGFQKQFKNLKKTIPKKSVAGHSAGHFKKKKSYSTARKQTAKSKSAVMTETMAKLLPKGQKIEGINADWRKRKKQGIPQLPLIIFLLCALVAIPIFFIIRDAAREKQRKEQEAIRVQTEKKKAKEDTERLARIAKREKEAAEKAKAHAEQLKAALRRQEEERKTTGNKLVDELNKILAYSMANKYDFDQPLQRLSALLEQAGKAQDFALMDQIRNETFRIERAREKMYDKNKRIFLKLLNPPVKAKDFERAMEVIEEFSTPSQQITNELKSLALQQVKPLHEEYEQANKSKLYVAELKYNAAFLQIVPLIMDKDYTTAQQRVEALKETPDYELTKGLVKQLATDVEKLEHFDETLQAKLADKISTQQRFMLTSGQEHELEIVDVTPKGLTVKLPGSSSSKQLSFSAISAKTKIEITDPENELSLFARCMIYQDHNDLESAAGRVDLMKMYHKKGLADTIINHKAMRTIEAINKDYELLAPINSLPALRRAMAQLDLKTKPAGKFLKEVKQYAKDYGHTEYYQTNKEAIDEIELFCNQKAQGEKYILKITIAGTTAEERLKSLKEELTRAIPETVIILTTGEYGTREDSTLVINTPNITITSDKFVKFNTAVTINGQSLTSRGVNYNILSLRNDITGSRIENAQIDKLNLINANDGIITNSVVKGLVSNNSEDIMFDFCTFYAAKRRNDPGAITTTQSKIEIENSVIYSAGPAIAFRPVDNKKEPRLRMKKVILFGETGLIYDSSKPNKKNSFDRNKVRQYTSSTGLIYDQPIFNDPDSGDYTLAPNSPGYGSAGDGKSLGVSK